MSALGSALGKYLAFVILLFSLTTFAKPLRVVTLSPAITELIYALHFENLLIGVSDFSDYPEEAKKLSSVGPYTKPNFEKMVELKPDLVFLPLEGPEDVKNHLDQLHLRYIVVSMRTLREIGEAAENISNTLENPREGKVFKIHWDETLTKLFSHKKEKSKSVFIEIQRDPLIAAGSKTFLDEIVNGCGGANIVKEKGYPRLSLEFISSKKIDFVLLGDYFKNSTEREIATKWWASKKNPPKNIVILDADTTARPGPRLLRGVKSICEVLGAHK